MIGTMTANRQPARTMGDRCRPINALCPKASIGGLLLQSPLYLLPKGNRSKETDQRTAADPKKATVQWLRRHRPVGYNLSLRQSVPSLFHERCILNFALSAGSAASTVMACIGVVRRYEQSRLAVDHGFVQSPDIGRDNRQTGCHRLQYDHT